MYRNGNPSQLQYTPAGFQHSLMTYTLADIHQFNALFFGKTAQPYMLCSRRIGTWSKVVQRHQMILWRTNLIRNPCKILYRRRPVNIMDHAGIRLHDHNLTRLDRTAHLGSKDFFHNRSHYFLPLL